MNKSKEMEVKYNTTKGKLNSGLAEKQFHRNRIQR